MKKTNLYIDFEQETIFVSKAFHKRASIYGTNEFETLHSAIQETGYSVAFLTVQKKSYRGLSFERMEAYIITQPNSEANLKEFAAVKIIAEAKGSKYPLTKKWFLQTFPEYKLNEVSEKETETSLNNSEQITNINEAKIA